MARDPEVTAMQKILDLLDDLDTASAVRVMRFVVARHEARLNTIGENLGLPAGDPSEEGLA